MARSAKVEKLAPIREASSVSQYFNLTTKILEISNPTNAPNNNICNELA
jgi:hypothetical protein